MIRQITLLAVLASLAACGGDGARDGGFDPGGGGDNGGDWQEGVFLDWIGFYQQCATTLDQNNFLRSYSNDTYLWYDEIVDRGSDWWDEQADPVGCIQEYGAAFTSHRDLHLARYGLGVSLDFLCLSEPPDPAVIFTDGFESGDTSAWSLTVGP